jgi:hypothetical protein
MADGRKRLYLLTLIALVGLVPLRATAQGFRFANIPWGSNGVTMKQMMADQGLSFVEVDSEGDYKFKGTLNGYEAVVWGLMSTNGVAKISVTLFTPDEKARKAYQDMKTALTVKYGTPTEVLERFDPPYHDGDGREDQAVREDKGHLLALWKTPVDRDTSYLGLQVTAKLNVFLAYEGPGWGAELDKRRAKPRQNNPF